MRYMMIVSGSENLAEAGPPPASLMEGIEKLGEEAARNGTMLSFGGLKPTSSATRMRLTDGKIVATDGPFTEAKEVIGGFSIHNLPSRGAALEEARKFMELHRLHWPKWQGQVEIREMYEQEDDVQAAQVEGSRVIEKAGGPGAHDPR